MAVSGRHAVMAPAQEPIVAVIFQIRIAAFDGCFFVALAAIKSRIVNVGMLIDGRGLWFGGRQCGCFFLRQWSATHKEKKKRKDNDQGFSHRPLIARTNCRENVRAGLTARPDTFEQIRFPLERTTILAHMVKNALRADMATGARHHERIHLVSSVI